MATTPTPDPELAQLRSLRDSIARMMADPTAREHFLRAEKVAFPQVNNGIEIADKLKEETGKTSKEVAELRAELAKEREEREAARKVEEFRRSWDSQKQNLRNDGYMDGAISQIEKIAHERGIADLTIAAAVYDKANPPPAPVAGGGSLSFFQSPREDDPDRKDYFKKLIETKGENDGVLMGQVGKVLGELRGQRTA